jgi:hypothetical protein
MEIDPSCYTFKRMEVEKGLFDSSVDATYVITLEGNGRYERIIEELKKYHPTRIVYIMTNRGYKRCKKNLHKDISIYDLTDAFINVFKHANMESYKNILVLEDDFMFSEKLFDQRILSTVNQFISARTDTYFIYLLGVMPQIMIPYDSSHYIPVESGGMHAVVYSRLFRDKAIEDDNNTVIGDWDLYGKKTYNRYTYHEPLAYQLFPVTDNSLAWFENKEFVRLLHYILKMFKLDIQVEPGYSIFYILSKSLFYILILFFIGILVFIGYSVASSKTIKRFLQRRRINI